MNNYTSLVDGSYFKYTPHTTPNTIYIDPAGIDNAARSGSASDPFRSLAYACTRCVTPGWTIHVNKGTYPETVQSTLAVGVSIEGEGWESHISSTVAFGTNACILLASAAEGTDGNQHISFLRINGNMTSSRAILVGARSNVVIHDCDIYDFVTDGVWYHGRVIGVAGEPVTYAVGNHFYNNRVTNCSGNIAGTDGRGELNISGQSLAEIHHNTLITSYRGVNQQGYVIKAQSDGGFNRTLKIHHNYLYRPPFDNQLFDFGIEFWDITGGIEVYQNEFVNCSIDIGGFSVVRGAEPYSIWIHDNRLGQEALTQYEATRGIVIEGAVTNEYIIIERNFIYNTATGINFGGVLGTPNNICHLYISCNICDHIGVSDAGAASKGWGIYSSSDPAATNSRIEIYNNIFKAHIGGVRRGFIGILIPSSDFTTQYKVVNNIVMNFSFAAIRGYMSHGITENLDYYWIENNIWFNNGAGISWEAGYAHTNGFENDNQIADPLFVDSANADFRLQAGSPAINAALPVYAPQQYFDGKFINDQQPEIGAYKYV